MPGEEEPEPSAPATWRRQSSRVLGALAALNEARGASRTAETLSDRAKRARSEEPEVRQLPRCATAFQSIDEGRLDAARTSLQSWLADASVLLASKRDRFEAHLGLATVAKLQGFHAEVDGHLREAFAVGASAPSRTSLLVALVTGRALLAVGRPDLAATFLDPRTERDGTLQHLRAELALANDELARAQIHAGEALELHNRRFSVESAEHAETRMLIARIHVRAQRHAAAENTLALAIDTFKASAPRNHLAEAESYALAAMFLANKKDFVRARRAIDRASNVARSVVATPCSALLPILVPGALVFHAAGDSKRGSAWDGYVAHARAWLPPSR
jgi:hypothetical protein